MILSYGLRLVFLSAASFYLTHLALGVVAAATAPMIRRRLERWPASGAEALLLGLRLLPAVSGLLAVAVFCIPSYLFLETNPAPEFTGALCLIAAFFGCMVCSLSIGRALVALVRSRRYILLCSEKLAKLPEFPGDIFVVDSSAPCFALAGIFRPRLIVSRAVLDRLNREQLAAALSHERAHHRRFDNLRRLLVLLTPGLFPFFSGFGPLERAWERFLEWSADDRAVGGNPLTGVALASALLGVARMTVESGPNLLVCSLVSGADDLADRVGRLLEASGPPARPSNHVWGALAASTGIAAVGLVLGQPAALPLVHDLLERLLR